MLKFVSVTGAKEIETEEAKLNRVNVRIFSNIGTKFKSPISISNNMFEFEFKLFYRIEIFWGGGGEGMERLCIVTYVNF